MRAEAKKLFWSYPDAWYCVDGTWLYDGRYTGDTEHDIDFLACVKQLDVSLEYLGPEHWMEGIQYDELVDNLEGMLAEAPIALLQRTDKRICDFWQTLQHRCPRATCVILSITAGLLRPNNSLSVLEKRIVNMCPAGISVFASLLQGDGSRLKGWDSRMERNLWRLTGEDALQTSKWELICPTWTQRNIFPPHKEFRGPVGWFQRGHYKYHRFNSQNLATRVLLNEAIERDHFYKQHKPFNCFNPKCDAWFNLIGEWTQHANKTRHDEGVAPPDNVKALFNQHKNKLKRLEQEMNDAQRSIFNAWNLINGKSGEELGEGPLRLYQPEHDEDQAMIYHLESELQYYARDAGFEQLQYEAELAFLYQIEHDPLYAQAKPARESRLWESYEDLYVN
jgi:hypothetical protein